MQQVLREIRDFALLLQELERLANPKGVRVKGLKRRKRVGVKEPKIIDVEFKVIEEKPIGSQNESEQTSGKE